jgi:alpha-1,3-rhamnosyl/mannosyltransferase
VTDRLQVAVNLLWLVPGRVGGSEEYLVRQLTGLDAPDVAVTVFGRHDLGGAHPGLAARVPVRTAPGRRDHRGERIVLEHSWLAVRARGADVVHHGGGTVPLAGPGPVLLTVHDLQYRTFPHYFGRARRSYLAAMVPRSVRRASAIATPSEYVRSTVIAAFGAPEERVVVVPHGVPDLPAPTVDAQLAARDRLGVGDRPYVVYPAITHPHKGHTVLVDMLADLDRDVLLVLIGGEGAAEAAVRGRVAASTHADRVVRTGRVGPDIRDALVAGAEALVMPSEYEGFGAPLVEAMALGTPVVASDAPAVTEVVADAGVIVTERRGAAWAEAVEVARRDRDALVARGFQRREAFTLATSGRALAAAYRLAAAVEEG